MRKKRIDPIVSKTIEVLDYPPEVVADAIAHAFKYMKEYVAKPTAAGLRYQHFGVIRPSIKSLNWHLSHKMLPKLRANRDDEELKQKFRVYWQLRDLIRKDNERRNYKERFGS
jgi:hypothetical protein